MQEIELTQGQVSLVDDIDYEYLSQWKWHAHWHHNRFRVKRTTDEKKAIYMHTVVAERMGIDTTQIDHKDHNPLNNCRSNLRSATTSQNGHNCEARKTSKTGVKGVSFHKARDKYRAEIRFEGEYHYLGSFDTIPEAATVVQHKREELVGEFACH